MIIACIGTHGTGKTTVLDILRDQYGYGLVDGVTRPLIRAGIEEKIGKIPYQKLINELTILQHQPLLCVKDIVLTTRSILDCVAYGRANGIEKGSIGVDEEKFLDWQKENNHRYVFMYFPIEFEISGDECRPADKGYQKRVDKECLDVLDDTGTGFYIVKGTLEERVKIFLDVIKSYEEGGFDELST